MTKGPKVVQFPGWRSKLRTNNGQPVPNGKPIADLANVLIALRNEPAFAVAFAFDEMQQSVIVRANPPLAPGVEPRDAPRFADEEDITRLQEWMQTIMPKVGRETIHWALEEFGRSNPIHPLRLWLQTREIGVRQDVLPNWLSYALGVPNDAYHREVGKRFAIAMVARVLNPGCQADYMLVLEGPQGEEKSKFCRALAGAEYFSDNIPSLSADQVRVSMHMRGKWLIEIGELAAFNNVSDVETLKAFITRREEIYTPKYGRRERREPRQCVFIGTTNSDDWNRDETGAAASGRSRSSTSTSNGWPSTATSCSPKPCKPTRLASRIGPTTFSRNGSSPRSKRSACFTTLGPIFSPRTSNGRPQSPSPKPRNSLKSLKSVWTCARRSGWALFSERPNGRKATMRMVRKCG